MLRLASSSIHAFPLMNSLFDSTFLEVVVTFTQHETVKDRSQELNLFILAKSPCFLPADLSIRDHAEFAFSKWIS